MTTPDNPAETYESYMVPTLFGPFASRLVQILDLRPGDRVLDVACGTGIVARTIAARPGHFNITGLDVSGDMLAVARAKARDEGHHIDWKQGRAERMPFPDASFDKVACQFALMFFEDRQAALGEMHRLLARGGRVALAVWQGFDRHPFYQTLHHVIEHHLGTSALATIFSLGDTDHLRSLMAGAGFDSVHIDQETMRARFPEPDAFLAGEIDVDTAAIPAMQHLGVRERETIISMIRADMESALAEVTEDGHVILPFHAHLIQASR